MNIYDIEEYMAAIVLKAERLLNTGDKEALSICTYPFTSENGKRLVQGWFAIFDMHGNVTLSYREFTKPVFEDASLLQVLNQMDYYLDAKIDQKSQRCRQLEEGEAMFEVTGFGD